MSEHKSIPNSTGLRYIARRAVHRVVCIILVVTFGFSALAIRSVSAVMQMGGDCCQGRAAGHCESTILKKARQRKPEPMCGLKPASVDDAITIVAEPLATPGPDSSSFSRSVGRSCPTECCATAVNLAQKRNEQGATRTEFRFTAPFD